LTVLKQNPSLVEEQRDLGKAAAKVAETVATEVKRVVGGAPKPSVPHAKPPTKPTTTKPQITKPRKPPSSRCKRPLDTAREKADSLVPATTQITPQTSAHAPKKPKLSTQPETRAPPKKIETVYDKINASDLRKIGQRSLQSDIRQINGNQHDAFNFFKAQQEFL